MITKERLEELIKEGATIYEAKYGKVISVDLLKVTDYFMSKEYVKFRDFPTYYLTRIRYNRLFEAKEDAEWFAKFGNISRTETLSLPTWEEIQKNLINCPDGGYYIADNSQITLVYYKPSGFEVIGRFDNYHFNGTKENYLEACEICRKLFLGEE